MIADSDNSRRMRPADTAHLWHAALKGREARIAEAMDGVELEIRPSALAAIARKALARKTGARGLRSILEHSLIDTMFDLPTMDRVAKVVIDEHIVEDGAKPLLVYREHKASA